VHPAAAHARVGHDQRPPCRRRARPVPPGRPQGPRAVLARARAPARPDPRAAGRLGGVGAARARHPPPVPRHRPAGLRGLGPADPAADLRLRRGRLRGLQQLDLGPCTVVGHSLGGAVAAAVAERHPEAAALALLAPAGFGPIPLAEVMAARASATPRSSPCRSRSSTRSP
jgi:pimeloyl-ACP methyl ester carboxylesterase